MPRGNTRQRQPGDAGTADAAWDKKLATQKTRLRHQFAMFMDSRFDLFVCAHTGDGEDQHARWQSPEIEYDYAEEVSKRAPRLQELQRTYVGEKPDDVHGDNWRRGLDPDDVYHRNRNRVLELDYSRHQQDLCSRTAAAGADTGADVMEASPPPSSPGPAWTAAATRKEDERWLAASARGLLAGPVPGQGPAWSGAEATTVAPKSKSEEQRWYAATAQGMRVEDGRSPPQGPKKAGAKTAPKAGRKSPQPRSMSPRSPRTAPTAQASSSAQAFERPCWKVEDRRRP